MKVDTRLGDWHPLTLTLRHLPVVFPTSALLPWPRLPFLSVRSHQGQPRPLPATAPHCLRELMGTSHRPLHFSKGLSYNAI